MATTYETVDGLLQFQYGPDYVHEQQNLEPGLLEDIPKASEKPVSKGFQFNVHLGGNMAGGPFLAEEPLNRAQVERTEQVNLKWKNYHWPIEVTNEVLDVANSNVAAFAAAFDFQVEQALRSMRKLMSQDVYGDGKSTRTTIVGNQSATDTLTVADYQRLRQFMEVDIYRGSTPVYRGLQVTYIYHSSNQIKVSESVTVLDGDRIVLKGTQVNAPADGKSLMGLDGIVDDGTVQGTYLGLDRTLYPTWTAEVFDADSGSISGDMLLRVCDRVAFRSGEIPNRIQSGPQQRRAYLAQGSPLKRFMDDNIDMGYSGVQYNAGGKVLEWYTDTDAPRDIVWLLNMRGKGVEKFITRETSLDDTTGTVLKWIPGYDKFFAYYIARLNVATRYVNRNAKITSLNTPPY